MNHYCECGHLPSYHYGDTGHCEAVDPDMGDFYICPCPRFEGDPDE